MIELGKYNTLEILRETSVGLFLGDEGEEVLLPTRYVAPEMEVGDEVQVFVYNDSEDRLVAVREKPLLFLDEFGPLVVKDVNNFGAFMEWGLIKDLMVPYREQDGPMEVGETRLVYLYLDAKTERLVGSCKLSKFLNNVHIALVEKEEIDIIIWKESELGFKVVINEEYEGLIFHSDVFKTLEVGSKMKAFVKTIREDNKIDVTLQIQGFEHAIDSNAAKVLQLLNENDGYLDLHDKSSPDDIKEVLEMSKKNFKKAIGTLYKTKTIIIEKNGIRLVK